MVIDFNYWTKVIHKLVIALITILFVFVGFKLAIFYMPFLVAFIISLILEPIIRFIMKHVKLKRKQSAIIIIIAITGLIIGLLGWAISTIINEASSLLNNIDNYVETAFSTIQTLLQKISSLNLNIPSNLISAIEDSAKDMISGVTEYMQGIVKSLLIIITSIPNILIYFSIMFLALYFICTDKVYMIDQLEHHLPELWVKKLYVHIKDLIKVLGGYVRAEGILIIISFIISLIGLYVFHFAGMNVKYPLLYALGIGFIDALPILGSETIMVPWAIIASCNGEIKLGVSIIILWIVMCIVRQMMEPKMVGNHIGIHPIFTLIAMYTGFKIVGVIGLFIGPIVLIVLKNVFGDFVDKGVMKSIFSRES